MITFMAAIPVAQAGNLPSQKRPKIGFFAILDGTRDQRWRGKVSATTPMLPLVLKVRSKKQRRSQQEILNI
jgi:hypothetical protein